MRKMKDSGVEWIGEIPEGWRIQRLKFAIESHFGGVWGKAQGEDEIDSICVRIADFNYPLLSVNFNDEMTIRAYKSSVFKECSIKYEDILLEKSGGGEVTPLGRSVAFESTSDMMCANFIECLRPKKQQNYRFLNYWLSCAYHNGLSKRNIKQTTGIQNLDITSFFNEKAVVVPLDEQISIVDYIDNRCAEIDKVIKAKEITNEKLKEYRQSIIYEAVTKGLNKNSKMKDSGIEWIGEIPKGWHIEKLKYHAEFNPVTKVPYFEDDDEVSFVPMENLKNGYHLVTLTPYSNVKKGYTTFSSGDILIAKVTPCFENGNLAIAKNLIKGIGFGSTEINIIRCHDIETQYLFYYLQTPKFIERATFNMFGVAGLKRLAPSFIPESYYPIPPLDEQTRITDYLDRKCAEIDSVISANEKTIDKLKEYRQSIIYEAVTGKVEVM